MSIRFSLVYPTRHRPDFVRQALLFLTRQTYTDFEVIVSDNYTDSAMSCEQVCRESGLSNLRYVRPPVPVGMVESWNHALQFAAGDYVAYFTDKMFLLPATLARAARAISASGFEIVNWAGASYSPARYPDYFGAGSFTYSPPDGAPFKSYEALAELSQKGLGIVPRPEQDPFSYARGKICFGVYSRGLCDRIVQRTGALFHPISPDYTSMILGLSLAKTAGQIAGSGILHLDTDLSNGLLYATRDDAALRFLRDLGTLDELLAELPVPGLYSAVNNSVARDYAVLRQRFDLPFEFSLPQWLVYMAEDLERPERVWSSPMLEAEHKALLANFIARLDGAQREQFHRLRGVRAAELRRRAATPPPSRRRPSEIIEASLWRAARAILPQVVATPLKRLIARRASPRQALWQTVQCAAISDVLENSFSS